MKQTAVQTRLDALRPALGQRTFRPVASRTLPAKLSMLTKLLSRWKGPKPLGRLHLSTAKERMCGLLNLKGGENELQDFLASLILSEVAYKKLEMAPHPLARKISALVSQFPAGWVQLHAVQVTRPVVAHHYIVALGPGAMYVAFMGTKQARDLLTDAYASHEPMWAEALALATDDQAMPSAHRGFLRRARAVDIEQIYAQARAQDRRLVLCGHSLGGAVAKLCTLRLLRDLAVRPAQDSIGGWAVDSPTRSRDRAHQLRCVCFATPAVGNAALARLVDSAGWAHYFSTYFLPEDQLMRMLSLLQPRAALSQLQAASGPAAPLNTAPALPSTVAAIASAQAGHSAPVGEEICSDDEGAPVSKRRKQQAAVPQGQLVSSLPGDAASDSRALGEAGRSLVSGSGLEGNVQPSSPPGQAAPRLWARFGRKSARTLEDGSPTIDEGTGRPKSDHEAKPTAAAFERITPPGPPGKQPSAEGLHQAPVLPAVHLSQQPTETQQLSEVTQGTSDPHSHVAPSMASEGGGNQRPWPGAGLSSWLDERRGRSTWAPFLRRPWHQPSTPGQPIQPAPSTPTSNRDTSAPFDWPHPLDPAPVNNLTSEPAELASPAAPGTASRATPSAADVHSQTLDGQSSGQMSTAAVDATSEATAAATRQLPPDGVRGRLRSSARLQRLLHLAPQMPRVRLPSYLSFHQFGSHLYLGHHGAHPVINHHPTAAAATDPPAAAPAAPAPAQPPRLQPAAAGAAPAAPAGPIPLVDSVTASTLAGAGTRAAAARFPWRAAAINLPSNPFAYHRMVAYRTRVLHLVQVAVNNNHSNHHNHHGHAHQHMHAPQHPVTVSSPQHNPTTPGATVQAASQLPSSAVGDTELAQTGQDEVKLRTDIVPPIRVLRAVARPPLPAPIGFRTHSPGAPQQVQVQVSGLQLQHCRSVEAIWYDAGGKQVPLTCSVQSCSADSQDNGIRIGRGKAADVPSGRGDEAGQSAAALPHSSATGSAARHTHSRQRPAAAAPGPASSRWRRNLQEAAGQVVRAVNRSLHLRAPRPASRPASPSELSRMVLNVCITPAIMQQLLTQALQSASLGNATNSTFTGPAPAARGLAPAEAKTSTAATPGGQAGAEQAALPDSTSLLSRLRLQFASDFHTDSVDLQLVPWRLGVVTASPTTAAALDAVLAEATAPLQPAPGRRLAMLETVMGARDWPMWRPRASMQPPVATPTTSQAAARTDSPPDETHKPGTVMSHFSPWSKWNTQDVIASGPSSQETTWDAKGTNAEQGTVPLPAGNGRLGAAWEGSGQMLAAGVAAAAAAAATAAPSSGVLAPPPPLPRLTAALSFTAAASRVIGARAPPPNTSGQGAPGAGQAGKQQAGQPAPTGTARGAAGLTDGPRFPLLTAPPLRAADPAVAPADQPAAHTTDGIQQQAALPNGRPLQSYATKPSATPTEQDSIASVPMEVADGRGRAQSQQQGLQQGVTNAEQPQEPVASRRAWQAIRGTSGTAGPRSASWPWLPRAESRARPDQETLQPSEAREHSETSARDVAAVASRGVKRTFSFGGTVLETVEMVPGVTNTQQESVPRPVADWVHNHMLRPLDRLVPRAMWQHVLGATPSQQASTSHSSSSIHQTPSSRSPWDVLLVVLAVSDAASALSSGACAASIRRARNAGVPILPLLLIPPPGPNAGSEHVSALAHDCNVHPSDVLAVQADVAGSHAPADGQAASLHNLRSGSNLTTPTPRVTNASGSMGGGTQAHQPKADGSGASMAGNRSVEAGDGVEGPALGPRVVTAKGLWAAVCALLARTQDAHAAAVSVDQASVILRGADGSAKDSRPRRAGPLSRL